MLDIFDTDMCDKTGLLDERTSYPRITGFRARLRHAGAALTGLPMAEHAGHVGNVLAQRAARVRSFK